MNLRKNGRICRPALLVLGFLSCGFTWGSSLPPCDKASEAVKEITRQSSADKRLEAEKKVRELCAEGGAAHYLKGLALEAAQRQEEAVEEYRSAVKKDPQLAEAHGRLGLLLFEKGAREEASVELFEASKSKPDPDYARALGDIFQAAQLYALALSQYERALPTYGNDAKLRVGMARSYLGLGERAKARDLLVEALRLDPANLAASLELAEIYRGDKQYQDALQQLKQASAAHPDNRDIHFRLARLLDLMGEEKLADAQYRQAGMERASTPADHLEKAALYQQGTAFLKAAREYEALLLKQPDAPGVREKLGDALLAAGHDGEAITAYEEALRRKETSSQLLYNLGTLYERKGDLDQAIRRFSEAIRLDPENGDARRRLAEIHTVRGDLDAAIAQYRELVSRHGDNPLSYYKLARLYEQRRQYEDAIRAYSKAIELDQDSEVAHLGIARLYQKRKQPEQAEKHLIEVLRLDPKHAEARELLISLYVKARRYDDTEKLLKASAELNPESANDQYRLGVIYAFRGNNDGAREQYQKALALKPDHARALNALGKLYLRLGEKEKAREALAAARKADPDLLEPVELLSKLDLKKAHKKQEYRKHLSKHKKVKKVSKERKGKSKKKKKARR